MSASVRINIFYRAGSGLLALALDTGTCLDEDGTGQDADAEKGVVVDNLRKLEVFRNNFCFNLCRDLQSFLVTVGLTVNILRSEVPL